MTSSGGGSGGGSGGSGSSGGGSGMLRIAINVTPRTATITFKLFPGRKIFFGIKVSAHLGELQARVRVWVGMEGDRDRGVVTSEDVR